MNSKKVLRLGLVALYAVFLPALAARSQEKKAEPKAPETRMLEIVNIRHDDLNPTEGDSESRTVIYISGDNYRIEIMDNIKDPKTLSVTIIKGGDQYNFTPSAPEKQFTKSKATSTKEDDILVGYASGLGRRWSDVLASDWHETSSRKVVITKPPNQKWLGVDCEVYKASEKFDPNLGYSLYYLDSQKRVRRQLHYYPPMPESNGKDVLDMEFSAIKYEVGKPIPKETFEIPEGFREFIYK